jgi:two-component sensor histidine kinase
MQVIKLGLRYFVVMALGLWAVIVLLFASQFVIVSSFTWRDAFVHAGFFWLPWMLFMPIVVWFAFRFPLEKGRMILHVGVHLLACIAIVSANQVLFLNFMPAPPLVSGENERRLGPPPGELGRELDLLGEMRPRPGPPEEDDGPMPPDGDRRGPRPPGGRNGRRPNAFAGLRASLDILVYWSLLSVCQTIISFRRVQERERREAALEARLTRSKLQSLRMQINPHFLFNTLNAISTLVYVNPRAADEMIADLSELLRSSLDSANEQEITLARELEFIRHYIGIEKKRFGDRLVVEERIAPEVMNVMVPALILQPLVENAIRHGIEPQRAPGTVTVEASREGRDILLRVIDNGRGLTPNRRDEGSERGGIGLANARARLRELYGANQSLELMEREPQGCIVQIRLPYHLRSEIQPATRIS